LLAALFYASFDKEKKKQVFYELKYPTFIKRKRPGESRRSKLARRATQRAKKVKQREEDEYRCSILKKSKQIMSIQSKSKSKEVPSYVGRYLLGSGPKYVPIVSGSSDRKLMAPMPWRRNHNYRRKALIATNNQKNYNNKKNKSSLSGCNFKSDIYNFSLLFSDKPVNFGMSIHALTTPTRRFNSKSKKKSFLRRGDVARMAKRQDLFERILTRILSQQESMYIFYFCL